MLVGTVGIVRRLPYRGLWLCSPAAVSLLSFSVYSAINIKEYKLSLFRIKLMQEYVVAVPQRAPAIATPVLFRSTIPV